MIADNSTKIIQIININIDVVYFYSYFQPVLQNLLFIFSQQQIKSRFQIILLLLLSLFPKMYQQQEQEFYHLPSLIQTTSLFWPNDQQIRNQLSLPLTLTFQPLEHLDHINCQSSFSQKSINDYRCHSCKAFINSLCQILSRNQYKCSICGCTNWLPTPINEKAPELEYPIFICKSKSPQFRSNNRNIRTFVFAIDLSTYEQETKIIIAYTIDIISEFLKNIQKQLSCAQQDYHGIQIMIVGFHDYVVQYKFCAINFDEQEDQNNNEKQIQKKNQAQLNEVEKIIDTNVNINYEEVVKNRSKVFIQIPKFALKIEQILKDIGESIKQRNRYSSSALIHVIQRIANYTVGCVGKVFVVTGFRSSKNPFITKMQGQPEQFRSNFTLNKKKCLSESLLQLLDKSQMSYSIFVYNHSFVNLLPLYAIAKMTNGQIKHYSPNNFHQFYYQFYYSVCKQSFQLGTQTILKVRYSAGVKLIGIFGQYRSNKNSKDQIELLSCSPNRVYMFQFAIQGKIQQTNINIQFSTLYTDKKGNRTFKVMTYTQKISDNKQQILDSINYAAVNQSYLWAVLYNMDLNVIVKNLQLTLQQRCRKHVKALEKYKQSSKQSLKKATPYIMFTYYLIGHFILNIQFGRDRFYDKSIEARSRIFTTDISGIYAIWPVVYSINQLKTKIVELKFEEIKDSQIGVVIDQGDFCYIYIVSEELRQKVIRKKQSNNQIMSEIISQIEQLQPLSRIVNQLRQQKNSGYMEIILLQNLEGAYVLDQDGPKSYSNFVAKLVA